MTKKAKWPPSREDALAYTAHLIEAKSKAVALADVLELMATYGITEQDFHEDSQYAWQRLAMALAHETGKFKYRWAPPPPKRYSTDAAIRDACLWLLTERLGNASEAARRMAKHWDQSPEYLRQRASHLKRKGLSFPARMYVPVIEEIWELGGEAKRKV